MITKLVSCIIALLFCNISFAKIWRVNNSVGVTADFTTAQEANNEVAVQAGDTIHLEPSATSYGSLFTNKRLVWISTGAFISIHPGEQASLNPGSVFSLTVGAGSSNSVFSINCQYQININTSSIRLERCYSGDYVAIFGSNAVIINCYSKGSLRIYQGTNHIISNNIFEDYLSSDDGTSATITNNVFNAVSIGGTTINNSTLQNNIFNKSATYTYVNCTVEYNMSAVATALPAGNNNQNTVNMSTVFNNNNGNTDTDFNLKVGSPAIGSGTPTSTDMGAYGGTAPFKYAVVPAVPAIYKIAAPSVPTGNTMSVIFSTKSNN